MRLRISGVSASPRPAFTCAIIRCSFTSTATQATRLAPSSDCRKRNLPPPINGLQRTGINAKWARLIQRSGAGCAANRHRKKRERKHLRAGYRRRVAIPMPVLRKGRPCYCRSEPAAGHDFVASTGPPHKAYAWVRCKRRVRRSFRRTKVTVWGFCAGSNRENRAFGLRNRRPPFDVPFRHRASGTDE